MLARIWKHAGCSTFAVLIFKMFLVVGVALAYVDRFWNVFLLILCEGLLKPLLCFTLLVASREDLFIARLGSYGLTHGIH